MLCGVDSLTCVPKDEGIKKIGVILRPSTPGLKDFFLHLKNLLEREGFSVMLDSISGGMIGLYGVDFIRLCAEIDILITLGGDGTLISAARRSHAFNKPILGINTGRLGFLTAIQKDEVDEFIMLLKRGKYRVESRLMLEGKLSGSSNSEPFFAVNDIIIARRPISSMIEISARVDGVQFNTYYGDGLIVATPTGSTAYNISAGGPVVYPYSKNMILTPICAHSLTQRPLVLPSEFVIELRLEEEEGASIVIDGQEMLDLQSGESLTIKVASSEAHFIHRLEHDYFRVLREKFSWGAV